MGEILFSVRDWPRRWGLYTQPSAETMYSFSGLGINTLINPADGTVHGATFNVARIELLLALGEADRGQYRPEGLVFRRAGSAAAKSSQIYLAVRG